MREAETADLAIIHWDYGAGIIEMLDMANRRVARRKVHCVGAPTVTAIIYQKHYRFTCNMGTVERGQVRH